MQPLQYQAFTSVVTPQFWHHLSSLKIDVLKLDSPSLPITATYSAGRSVFDRESGKEVSLGCVLGISADALDTDVQVKKSDTTAKGFLKNFNTIEEFKAADKKALFNDLAAEIWASFDREGQDPDLNRFLLITFADLKKYRFHYWFAFPGFVPHWDVSDAGLELAQDQLGVESLEAIYRAVHGVEGAKSHPGFFLLRPSSAAPSSYEIGPLHSYKSFFSNTPSEQRIVAFLDPSASPTHAGWPIRNLLCYLSHIDPTLKSIRILCWRDTDIPPAGRAWKSRLATVTSIEGAQKPESGVPAAFGWEKNPAGKLIPKLADLGGVMDPIRLADQALTLNLKLMRWRILPALDLDKVAATKCLMLGAGTLGCYVARTLMAWGIRKLTFVDSARVSFSNPARQPLFEFEDCLEGGKPKAECAAERLKKVFPGVDATGYSLSIPMPGHPIPPQSEEQALNDVRLLEKLIDEHDVVFLLMDSRESRWLPSIIAGSKGKIVMNTALGFDTFVAMRHGPRASSYPADYSGPKLGCYYCNDIVAPKDSLTDRTLDQMCTVTRPGLASIAASTTVELLVSMIQHPQGVHCPAPPSDANSVSNEDQPAEGASILGLIPHQIRGFLAQFRNLNIVGQKYDRCTGCSETVLKAYETEGFPMLLRAFNETGFLENLTGLDKLYDESEAAMENVDWEEAEGEGGDDF